MDLSPAALARIAPGLTLRALAALATPPLDPAHVSRIAAGRAVTATTRHRVEAALARAAELAAAGEMQMPRRTGRPRR